MPEADSALAQRITGLSHEELLAMCEANPDDYTEQALHLAHAELARRGGTNVLRAEVIRAEEEELKAEVIRAETDSAKPRGDEVVALGNMAAFDLGRFTWAGWLVFLLSAGAGVGAMLILEEAFPRARTASGANFNAFAAVGVVVAFFFGARAVLMRLGVTLVRPKKERN